MKKSRQIEKKPQRHIHHKMRVLKIFTLVLVLIVAIIIIALYSASRKDTVRVNDAINTMLEGDYASALEKCDLVDNEQKRSFCFSFYLGSKIAELNAEFSSRYGDSAPQQKIDSLNREIRKEYVLVCGYDTGNPYMRSICAKWGI